MPLVSVNNSNTEMRYAEAETLDDYRVMVFKRKSPGLRWRRDRTSLVSRDSIRVWMLRNGPIALCRYMNSQGIEDGLGERE